MNSSQHSRPILLSVSPRMWWGVFIAVTLLAFGMERKAWLNEQSRMERLSGWLSGVPADWLPFLPLLLLAPLLGVMFRSRVKKAASQQSLNWWNQNAANDEWLWRTYGAAAVVFTLAFYASTRIGSDFQGFPPAYHDEYSYLFQAETFLSGRLSFPSPEVHPEIFDQMHVLNEGNFASRYFPGTGLWMMPFVATGLPWLGHQLAHALIAMMLFWAGREISSNAVGLLAGLLFALSPGPLLFSNLLLAHHPTLVGLSLFLWAFLRWMRMGSLGMALLAGGGLAFAMICRPPTAAGFGLPFGILFASWWVLHKPKLSFEGSDSLTAVAANMKRRTVTAVCLASPLIIGIAGMMFYNAQITGHALIAPYQQYTDIYSPRHVYGFNNVVRGEKKLGPKVITNYDEWAENLTPALAARNVGERIVFSLRWTLGIVPLLLMTPVVIMTWKQGDRRWLLIAAAIVTLHLIHIPYWFVGIMGWHYVFETAPLWILLFAEGTRRCFLIWQQQGNGVLRYWWGGLIAVSLLVNLLTVRPLWAGQLPVGMSEIAFPKQQYARFRSEIETLRRERDVIVFVIPDGADRHMDYVTNPPSLTGPVLVARLNDPDQLAEIASHFSGRLVLVYDAAKREFRRVDSLSAVP